MKIRTSFVSNSSTSNFVLIIDKEWCEEFGKTLESQEQEILALILEEQANNIYDKKVYVLTEGYNHSDSWIGGIGSWSHNHLSENILEDAVAIFYRLCESCPSDLKLELSTQ